MPKDPVLQTIKEMIDSHPIILFMKGSRLMPACGFSARVVEILNRFGVPYETKNVLDDDALREGIKVYSNWPTLPQLYVNGVFIGGCDIVCESDAKGELAPLIRGL
ncbi:MAG: Grx4 family monothiol glutaredoxin [Simkaniaceae bacterium]|nr:Grx4 family monothiol glutaredoxin [Simkaniaceae bacterium]